jgi:hypothetical protein
MTLRVPLFVKFALVLLLGILIGATALYLLYRPALWVFTSAPYDRAASDGVLNAIALEHLRQGEDQKVIELLENLLDSDILMLGTYESAISAKLRSPHIYESAARIRNYRLRFPRPAPQNLQVQQALERGLNLGSAKATDGP